MTIVEEHANMTATVVAVPDTVPAWVLDELPLSLLERLAAAQEDPAAPEVLWPYDQPAPAPRQVAGAALWPYDQEPDEHDEHDQAVGWAVPGVTGQGQDPTPDSLPAPSDLATDLHRLLTQLEGVDPTELPAAQALVDAQVLLEGEQRLRVLNLRRTGDVARRGLHELTGFRSAASWLREHRPDGDTGDATLARSLQELPVVGQAVEDGTISLLAAKKVAQALRQVRPHVDRADGLIDGMPGTEVLHAVVTHVVAVVCRSLQGLRDDDPRLAELVARATSVLSVLQHASDGTARPGVQALVLEDAFSWLAEELPVRHLSGALDELVCALLPSVLEDRLEQGRARRGLTLTPRPDGSGYRLEGDLDMECGERLWTALRAELQRDPVNPDDTAAWAAARDALGNTTGAPSDADAGAHAGDLVGDARDLGLASLADGTELPRSRAERLHDALSLLLDRYLGADLAGRVGKNAVQISVVVPVDRVESAAGAAPSRTGSGQLVPASLVRHWWCDSKVTAFVLSRGGQALRAVHAQRTVTGLERTALHVEGGHVCAGSDCCTSARTGRPCVFTPLRPHHPELFAVTGETSLDDTVPVCDALHHDVHDGTRTVRLRDGRYLHERGFLTEQEAIAQNLAPPPF